jgi:predicted metal-dependent hydrolase
VLRVARDGLAPTLTLPHGVPLSAATAFLASNEAWLRERLASGPLRVPVAAGTRLPFRGGELELRATGGRHIALNGTVLSVPGPAAEIGQRAHAWLREAARVELADRCGQHAAALGLRHRRLTLRDPRSRWGSCTSAGDLMFSWRLIMAPDDVLDYVAAHEVAHLRELNHSPRFWALVERLCPDMAGPRAWLRSRGGGLHAYHFAPSAAAGLDAP